MLFACLKGDLEGRAGSHYSKITIQKLVTHLAGRDTERFCARGCFTEGKRKFVQMKAVMYRQVVFLGFHWFPFVSLRFPSFHFVSLHFPSFNEVGSVRYPFLQARNTCKHLYL